METYAIEKMHKPIRFQLLKTSLLISKTILFIIEHTIQRGIVGNSWLFIAFKIYRTVHGKNKKKPSVKR